MIAIATVVSARTASRRLPGKALLDLAGVPMVQFLLDRLRDSRMGGPLVFATTQRRDDDNLAARVTEMGIPVFRGADTDVAGRYRAVAREFRLKWIVRVTGDCPFVDGGSLDHCLSQWSQHEPCDLLSTKGVFPVGIDYELFSTATLEREWPTMSEEEKEHVTLRLYRPELGFAVKRFSPPISWPPTRRSYVVDTPEDYEKAIRWARSFDDRTFSVQKLLELRDT